MRKLEELGISPAPWEVLDYGHCIASAGPEHGRRIVAMDVRSCDLNLIATAPELYAALLDALPWLADIGAEVVGNEAAEKIAAVVAKAEAALRKASGESEVTK